MKRLLFVGLLLAVSFGAVQAGDGTDTWVELLRSDLRADKEELVDLSMDLKQEDADAFWAIYKEYETDRVKLGDRTLELIKEFPDAAAVTGPTTIRTLAAEWLKLRDDKNKLIKKYYAMAEKQLSPRIASRWMQIEHRIGLLIDLQIASEVPLIDRLPR